MNYWHWNWNTTEHTINKLINHLEDLIQRTWGCMMHDDFSSMQGIAGSESPEYNLFPVGILLHHLLLFWPTIPVYPFPLGCCVCFPVSRTLNLASKIVREHNWTILQAVYAERSHVNCTRNVKLLVKNFQFSEVHHYNYTMLTILLCPQRSFFPLQKKSNK